MLFLSQVVPKGCKGTEAIHSSSSKHSSHKPIPNLSAVIKDVLISPYSPYLLNPARQLPRPVLQLKVGCQALGSGQPEPGLSWNHTVTPEPSVAKDLQRSCTSPQATHPAAGKLLHLEGENLGSSHLPTLTLQECCTHPLLLCMPTAPGSKNSFPSIVRRLQPLAFKMSRQAYVNRE